MSQRNRKRRPARKQPYRTPKIRILVVSEGTVTEREYIDGLAAAYRNSTRVDVETVGLGADPKTVVELWLLLHFVPNPGMQDRKEIRRRLKSYDFSYDKHVNFAIYEPTHKEAVQRGLRMDAMSIEDSELHRNPTTGFHALVSAIMEAS